MAQFELREESEDDEDAHMPGPASPQSPLLVDMDATSSSPHTFIAPDDHHVPDDPSHEESVDHAMEEEELDTADGMVLQEGVTQEGDKRSVYPQWGTAGRWGNAQSKRCSKVDINFNGHGNRAIPFCNCRCTDIAQMHSPQTKHCCNKPSNLVFFSRLWKLPFLLLAVFSSFCSAIFTVVQSASKESPTTPSLFQKISHMVKFLEDCSSRVTEIADVCARLEFTIAIDHETMATEAPPLPIVTDTCPLPALEVVEAAVFRESFARLVALITSPLRCITQSEAHFKSVIALVTPQGKASLMCCVEMGQNILGGGGGGKSSLVGNMLAAQRGTGAHKDKFLAPLESDLIKLSEKDCKLTGLSFGLSDQLVGFKVVSPTSATGDDMLSFGVTSNRSTAVLFSKSLKCSSHFLECLQRILVLMSGGLRCDGHVTHVEEVISFLQPLTFVHIATCNCTQVNQLIRSIADQVVNLHRHEWAAILRTLFTDPPFVINLCGVSTRVRTRAELEALLATIRSTEDLRTLWEPLAVHRKRPASAAQSIYEVNVGGECRFVVLLLSSFLH
jgi:hypothetical protein